MGVPRDLYHGMRQGSWSFSQAPSFLILRRVAEFSDVEFHYLLYAHSTVNITRGGSMPWRMMRGLKSEVVGHFWSTTRDAGERGHGGGIYPWPL